MLGLGRGWPAEVQISIFNVLVSVKLESQFFSLQKVNLLVTKVRYLHSKFSFCMSIFLRDSQIFSVTCGCVQKLNIYKIYLENLRFSSLVIEFFYPCSRVAANFFSLWEKASIIWCKTHLLLTRRKNVRGYMPYRRALEWGKDGIQNCIYSPNFLPNHIS